MTDASYITKDSATSRKLYKEKLFREVNSSSLAGTLMGEPVFDDSQPNLFESSDTSVIQQKGDLEIGAGDSGKGGQLQFSLLKNIQGDMKRGIEQMEGYEEDLTTYEKTLYPDIIRTAVKYYNISKMRATFDLPLGARSVLKTRMAEAMDYECIDEWTTAPSTIFYLASDTFSSTATAATAINAITSSDVLNPDIFTDLNTYAETGGAGYQDDPQKIIRPAVIDGQEMRILITHPDSMNDLMKDPEYKEFIMHAAVRGKDNPFFRKAKMIIGNTVVFTHRFIPTGTNSTGVRYCKGIYAGAQSLLWAWGKRPEVITEDTDYKLKRGTCLEIVSDTEKPVFNGVDYGSYGVYLACSNISNL